MEPTNQINPVKPSKLCTACKHCVAHPELLAEGQSRLAEYHCFAPANIRYYSAVDGSPVFRKAHCVDLRLEHYLPLDGHDLCRFEGNWWEPKPAPVEVTTPIAAKQVIKAGAKVGTNLLEDLGM